METEMSNSLSKSLKDRPVGAAPIEVVARALGYTEKELLLAGNVLNRFAWRYPAEPSRKNVNSTETEAIDSLSSRNPAA